MADEAPCVLVLVGAEQGARWALEDALEERLAERGPGPRESGATHCRRMAPGILVCREPQGSGGCGPVGQLAPERLVPDEGRIGAQAGSPGEEGSQRGGEQAQPGPAPVQLRDGRE